MTSPSNDDCSQALFKEITMSNPVWSDITDADLIEALKGEIHEIKVGQEKVLKEKQAIIDVIQEREKQRHNIWHYEVCAAWKNYPPRKWFFWRWVFYATSFIICFFILSMGMIEHKKFEPVGLAGLWFLPEEIKPYIPCEIETDIGEVVVVLLIYYPVIPMFCLIILFVRGSDKIKERFKSGNERYKDWQNAFP